MKVNFYRKEFLPVWAKFFPVRMAPIVEGFFVHKRKQEVTKDAAFCKNDGNHGKQ